MGKFDTPKQRHRTKQRRADSDTKSAQLLQARIRKSQKALSHNTMVQWHKERSS